MQWVDAVDPEECHWGFCDQSGLLGGGAFPVMPTWAQRFAHGDFTETFKEFRRLLKILLWKTPPPEGGHVVLKFGAVHAEAFLNVFPEGKVLLTHRDPHRSLVLSCVVFQAISEPFVAEGQMPISAVDGHGERKMLTGHADTLRAHVALDRDYPDRVASVHYSDLMADAIGTSRKT